MTRLQRKVTHRPALTNSVTSAQMDFKKRICIATLKGPWGDGGRLVFLRIRFRFPPGYPRIGGKEGLPSFDLEEKSDIPTATHRTMKQSIQRICEEERPCLVGCIAYLLGHEESRGRATFRAPDSDSDSEAGVIQHNVPSKRTCGATWGPNGMCRYEFVYSARLT